MEIAAYIAEDLQLYIGDGVALLVYLFVGVRLHALSVRGGQGPDRLLSACFLLWAFSYAIYDIPDVLFYRGAQFPALLTFISLFTLYLGSAAFTLFTCAVFRKRERWAHWLVAGTLGCMIVGLSGSAWVGDWGGERPLSNPWWWVAHVGAASPYFWMGAEGFNQYVKARQRKRLGLCSALVCNRFLLWGLAGSLWAVLEFIDVAQHIVFERTGQWSTALSTLVGWNEFIPGVLIGLAFFPPAFYRRWVEGRASDGDEPLPE